MLVGFLFDDSMIVHCADKWFLFYKNLCKNSRLWLYIYNYTYKKPKLNIISTKNWQQSESQCYRASFWDQ